MSDARALGLVEEFSTHYIWNEEDATLISSQKDRAVTLASHRNEEKGNL